MWFVAVTNDKLVYCEICVWCVERWTGGGNWEYVVFHERIMTSVAELSLVNYRADTVPRDPMCSRVILSRTFRQCIRVTVILHACQIKGEWEDQTYFGTKTKMFLPSLFIFTWVVISKCLCSRWTCPAELTVIEICKKNSHSSFYWGDNQYFHFGGEFRRYHVEHGYHVRTEVPSTHAWLWITRPVEGRVVQYG